jgi:exopolysaccharide biosynthesis polyprenyl glycosylphosphotransferase
VGFLGIALVLILLEKLAIKMVQNLVRVRGFNYHRVLMVGTGPAAAKLTGMLRDHEHLGMRVIGHLTLPGDPEGAGLTAPVLGPIEKLTEVLDNHIVDEVIFAAPASQLLTLEPHILKCEEVGVRVHLRADFVSTVLSRTYTSDIEGIPILTFSPAPHSATLLLVKRGMDLIISTLALVVLFPLMMLIAAAIKCTSPGPVLHRQERTGLNGRRFSLLKFRSMRLNAEKELERLAASNEMSGPVFKMRNDPRVTLVGRWLRRMSLDELPQLWNILRGDMSLVGPRPPIPREVEQYHRWQRRRLSMKPGLTCLWQVNGRNNVDFDTWMKLDMEYIDNWSLLLDFKILARTVSAVILARGAH